MLLEERQKPIIVLDSWTENAIPGLDEGIDPVHAVGHIGFVNTFEYALRICPDFAKDALAKFAPVDEFAIGDGCGTDVDVCSIRS